MIWGISLPFLMYFWHRKNCILIVFPPDLVSSSQKGKIPFWLPWFGILFFFFSFAVKLYLWVFATCRCSWRGQAAPRKVTEPFVLSNGGKKNYNWNFSRYSFTPLSRKKKIISPEEELNNMCNSTVLNFTDWYFWQSKESVRNCWVLFLFSLTSKPVNVHWWIKLSIL